MLEANQVFMRQQITEMNENVKEMHAILLQAKGARWAILGVASLAGFLSAKFGGIMSMFIVK